MTEQIQRCTPEKKRHMIDLIGEMREIVARLPGKDKSVVSRLKEIQTEMKAFRKRYPLD